MHMQVGMHGKPHRHRHVLNTAHLKKNTQDLQDTFIWQPPFRLPAFYHTLLIFYIIVVDGRRM